MNITPVPPNFTPGLADIFISIFMNVMLISPNVILSSITVFDSILPIYQLTITPEQDQIYSILPLNLLQQSFNIYTILCIQKLLIKLLNKMLSATIVA